ncbi:MAG TPA: hypothetical protein PK657_06135 [Legionella sp.]|nr:hypothetical protein [Legionella sp.]
MIKKIIFFYWQLVLLKETPENTPYSLFLMVLSAILLVGVMIGQWTLSNLDFTKDLGYTALIAISLVISFVVYTQLILFLKGLSTRLVQTVTCLFWAHIIIHLIAIPLFILDPYLVQAQVKNPLLLVIGVFYLFITLGLSVWQLVVTAHIYKYALNTTSIQSVLAAFGLIAVNVLTVSFWR